MGLKSESPKAVEPMLNGGPKTEMPIKHRPPLKADFVGFKNLKIYWAHECKNGGRVRVGTLGLSVGVLVVLLIRCSATEYLYTFLRGASGCWSPNLSFLSSRGVLWYP